MAAKVTINHSAVQEYLDGKHGVAKVLKREAGKVLSRAKAAAPVGKTGDYQSSIRQFTTHTDRMVERVGSDVDYALVVEADHGTLSRALDG